MSTKQGVFRLMMFPHQELAYHLGVRFRGCTLKAKADSYLLVVKTTHQARGAEVAFIEAESVYACWEYLHAHLTKTNAPLRFRPDKFSGLTTKG
jgi:hypothetical protein